MKSGIHPGNQFTNVRCTCGNQFHIYSKHESLTVDICSACHPFYTGTQKYVDTAGRVDAFTRRFAWNQEEAKKQAEKQARKQAGAAPERKPQADLKLELEKRKVFGKKKPVPVPGKGDEKQ